MYADGQCAHYRTNSGKGLQVLRPDLPYTLFLSLPLSFFLFLVRERGTERGPMTGIPLLAQTKGPTQWPRGIRKLAKPDLLVSFTCLMRAPATPVPFSCSSSFILHRVGIERRCIARRATREHGFAAHLYTHLPAYTRMYICTRAFRLVHVLLTAVLLVYIRECMHVRERQTTIDSVRTGHRCYTQRHENNNNTRKKKIY